MRNPLKIASPPSLDWFLPAILVMVGLAFLFPGPGTMQKPFSFSDIGNYAVSLVFFFYGIKLNPAELKKGLAKWRVHLLVQLCTFLLFPLIILSVRPFFTSEESQTLWFGIFFLATLPSTVSSSVVMVSIAGGNITTAIFNASISALIGVFITPLWIEAVFRGDTSSAGLSVIAVRLVLQVLLPVALGMLLHSRFGNFADKHKKAFRNFDQCVILLIIYTAFCKSFSQHLFAGLGWNGLFFLAMGMLSLFLLVMFLMNLLSTLLHIDRQDKITVLFCGSKKSLVHGTVMSGILFAGSPLAGIILLPIMLYHAIQLMVSAFIAKKIASAEPRTI